MIFVLVKRRDYNSYNNYLNNSYNYYYMKIFFNGWFSGFFDKTNPGLNKDFFLNLFEKVYNEKCYVGSLDESNILCEFCMLINTTTKLDYKQWKHTFMFSGESDLSAFQFSKTLALLF